MKYSDAVIRETILQQLESEKRMKELFQKMENPKDDGKIIRIARRSKEG